MAEPVSRVAATYVRLLYDHLQAQDVDAERLLGPLPPADQHFVPLNAWQGMLTRVQDLEGRPGLGLRVAAGISPRHFGVVGYAALACATLGEALLRLERYHSSVYDVNPAVVRHLPEGISIEWGVSRGKPGPLVDETAIASLVQLARDMTGHVWPVMEVSFVNPRPDDVRPYEDFFGGVVRFGAPVTRLMLSAEHLVLPLRKSDPALLALMDQQAEALLARVASVPAEVEAWRRTLVVLIREGRPALVDLARAHHLSPRSLQRRLAEQGLGFQRLLDDTRQHLAEGYMRQPGLDLAEIALLLGFSEQSAFTRAFRQWTGLAPAQWRKQALANKTKATP